MISEFLKSTLPEYEILLSKSNKKVKFRPMTVKQEKILLLSKDDSIQAKARAIYNILNDCYIGLNNLEKMNLIDIEKAFLHLRAKSIKETFEFGIQCPITKENVNIKTNIDHFKEELPEEKNIITLSKDVKVILESPKFSFYLDNKNDDDDIKNLFIHCFKELHTKNEVYNKEQVTAKEIGDFLDSMTTKQYDEVLNYIQNIPHIHNTLTYKTKDGIERKLIIRGLDSFFDLALAIST